MHPSILKCIKGVGHHFCCPYCNGRGIKYGVNKSGRQRYLCKCCGKTYLLNYIRKAYLPAINTVLVQLLKEGCSTRSISRLLCIAPGTVTKRIHYIARTIKPPFLSLYSTYELDEMSTYIGNKKNRQWIAYALCRENGKVADFRVGSRSVGTLSPVIQTLLLSRAVMICTDKLNLYKLLVPATLHNTRSRVTNHIERKNLTLRTHLKRLSRRTICFSKSAVMLTACLKIYFWG